jgi:hypothetical protein
MIASPGLLINCRALQLPQTIACVRWRQSLRSRFRAIVLLGEEHGEHAAPPSVCSVVAKSLTPELVDLEDGEFDRVAHDAYGEAFGEPISSGVGCGDDD